MSVVGVCSAKGSPGATTTALVLATSATWRDQAIVVEADPAGGDLASRLGIPSEPGLTSLAAAGRRELSAELVEKHCQHVAGIDIVAAPAGASAARSALRVLGDALPSALRTMMDKLIICDLGRLDADSASLATAKAADVILVVTRPLLADLAHVAEETEAWSRIGPPVGLVLSGEPGTVRRERYPAPEVSAALGLEVLGTLAWDPKGVAALLSHRREVKRSALVQSADGLARCLDQRLRGPADEATTALGGHPVPGTAATAGAEL
jgi:Mrp family chromosome partitioning ATPase